MFSDRPLRIRSLASLAIVSILFALAAAPGFAGEPAVYGDGPGEETAVAIAEILADPLAWQGKVVRVEGAVAGVCLKAGCWMELVDEQDSRLRIKVEDGVIVFPEDAIGQKATARGEVTVKDMTREHWVAWQRHLAEELGKEFDADAVGEGPFRLVQIAGTGAAIGG